MYKITKDGAALGMTEAVNYIKMHDNGCFVLCPEDEAQGIVHAGTAYHLLGRPDMGDAETIMLEEVDAGAELANVQAAVDDLTVAALMGGMEHV